MLFYNRSKSRKRRKRNILAMEVLHASKLGANEENTVQANSAIKMLHTFDLNEDDKTEDLLHWLDDIREKGRRISMLQASMMTLLNKEQLPCFERMIVLLSLLQQPSSAIVERAFSQVNCIHSLCGDNFKEDNIELQAMLRCNYELSENYKH